MTTEDDFQKALDANPDDWQTRLVFADWLEERGDPRADGYRALGRQQLYPIQIQMQEGDGKPGDIVYIFGTDANDSEIAYERWGKCFLPRLWFKKLKHPPSRQSNPWWRYFPTRREAEDATALAFARVNRVRRAELLAPPLAAPAKPGAR